MPVPYAHADDLTFCVLAHDIPRRGPRPRSHLGIAWQALQNYFNFAASSPSSAMTPSRGRRGSLRRNPDLDANGREARRISRLA